MNALGIGGSVVTPTITPPPELGEPEWLQKYIEPDIPAIDMMATSKYLSEREQLRKLMELQEP